MDGEVGGGEGGEMGQEMGSLLEMGYEDIVLGCCTVLVPSFSVSQMLAGIRILLAPVGF